MLNEKVDRNLNSEAPPMVRTTHDTLPDIQKTRDQRGLEIDEVGVGNIRYPISVPLRDGGVSNTVATIAMRVRLPQDEKGTHMSRFMLALEENGQGLSPRRLDTMLDDLLDRLKAPMAFIDMKFPMFLRRAAPVTGMSGLLDFGVVVSGVKTPSGASEKLVGVDVMAASLCPCSREISERGAHNQRSLIQIRTRPVGPMLWFEDLIDIAEASASCALFPVLKRPDEKFVTERAYDNPKFVEDIVRDTTLRLDDLRRRERIEWFSVTITNFESIHNHDAVARIERGVRGVLNGGEV